MAESPSGKDKRLKDARLYVGAYDLSGDSRNYGSLDNGFDQVEFTGWSENVMNFLEDGRRILGLRGYQAHLNDAAGRAFTILKDAPNNVPLSFVMGGGGDPAIPDPAYLMYGVQISDVGGFDGGAGIITADFLPDAAQYDAYMEGAMGVLLSAATSRSATYTGGSHDNEASSVNGWQANLHVLVSSGGTWAITIEHSTNDSDWATLTTFSADGSTVVAERKSGADTVNRYTRAVLTRTSGTLTAVITFGRVP